VPRKYMGLVVHSQVTGDRKVWAHGQLKQALSSFEVVCPVSNLDNLGVGDVLVSKSGNLRLVINMFPEGDRTVVHFLTRTQDENIRLEAATYGGQTTQESELVVNVKRVHALIKRRAGSPLVRFAELATVLPKNKAAQANLRGLLMAGGVSSKLRTLLQDSFRGNPVIAVSAFVDSSSGEILDVVEAETATAPSGTIEVLLGFDTSGSPVSDYISYASFLPETEEKVRQFILGSCVFSNTIANVHNIIETQRIAQG
jgi:hypothetical protein